MSKKRVKELKKKRIAERREKKARALRLLDEYDSKGYYRDLEYLGKISYISDGTKDWIEHRMYELRASANVYEHRVGELLISRGIEFIHQAPFVFRPKSIYFCDFYLPMQRIALEVDGIYHNSEDMVAKDAERDANFKSIGIRVVRIGNAETNDLPQLKLRLSEFIGGLL